MSDPDTSELLTVAQAIAIIDAAEVAPRVVSVALAHAMGLRLAEPIRADRDSPAFDKSLMDGFAVRSRDVRTTPADLRVVGEVAAGGSADRPLGAGEAMAIMTGAPLPSGADCVVPIEDTQPLDRADFPLPPGGEGTGEGEDDRSASRARSQSRVSPLTPTLSPRGERAKDDRPADRASLIRILRAGPAGRFIARRGQDVSRGHTVLDAGVVLGPAHLAAAASVGAAQLRVCARSRVAVLATGDELVPVDRVPGPTQIRNANNTLIAALLTRLGCDASDRGIVRDDPKLIRDAIAAALAESDVVVVSGGMSMGRYDHVPAVLRELGAKLLVTKLRIKPGKPFVFARIAERFVFGLPGNPVSGFVCTLRLASRLLTRLAGGQREERWIRGRLATPLEANGPREFYQPAVLRDDQVWPLAWKGSADICTLAAAGALLVRAENEPPQPAGAAVRVLEIPI